MPHMPLALLLIHLHFESFIVVIKFTLKEPYW